jgi:hypothetical protein
MLLLRQILTQLCLTVSYVPTCLTSALPRFLLPDDQRISCPCQRIPNLREEWLAKLFQVTRVRWAS